MWVSITVWVCESISSVHACGWVLLYGCVSRSSLQCIANRDIGPAVECYGVPGFNVESVPKTLKMELDTTLHNRSAVLLFMGKVWAIQGME